MLAHSFLWFSIKLPVKISGWWAATLIWKVQEYKRPLIIFDVSSLRPGGRKMICDNILSKVLFQCSWWKPSCPCIACKASPDQSDHKAKTNISKKGNIWEGMLNEYIFPFLGFGFKVFAKDWNNTKNTHAAESLSILPLGSPQPQPSPFPWCSEYPTFPRSLSRKCKRWWQSSRTIGAV